jgi:hypothetical protein
LFCADAGQYRMPFIRTPYLLSASQFDRYQLPYNEGSAPPYANAHLAYANSFQASILGVVRALPTEQQPGSAVFSSACFKHVRAAGSAQQASPARAHARAARALTLPRCARRTSARRIRAAFGGSESEG